MQIMLSRSPEPSASSPGPTSSLSSSAGSYYSSSASSNRQLASSGTSSNHTSPPANGSDLGKHHFSPASKSIGQAQQDVNLRSGHPACPPPHQRQSHSPRDPTTTHRLHRRSMESSLHRPLEPLSQYPVASKWQSSQPAMSQAVQRYDETWAPASTSSNHVSGYGSEEPMAVEPVGHAGVIHNFGTSPESSRGPLAKTRRTSPGGSRASGDLPPTAGTSFSTAASGFGASAAAASSREHAGLSSAFWKVAGGSPSGAGTEKFPASHSQVDRAEPSDQPNRSPFDRSWQAGSSQFGRHEGRDQSADVPMASKVSPRTQAADGKRKSPLAAAQNVLDSSRASPSTVASSSAASTSQRSHSQQPARTPQLPKMNLATFPPQDLLKVLATLLHEIATANDEFRPENGKDEGSRRSKPRSKDKQRSHIETESAAGAEAASPDAHRADPYTPGSQLSFTDARRPSTTTAALGALATPSSTLCFHARNVPSISIESYLLRILKYCPTTNEVFLSLLVYFDRMSRMGTGAKPGANGDSEIAGEAAGLPRAAEMASFAGLSSSTGSIKAPTEGATEEFYTHPGIKGFAIDSYNVHRLVIAGVTVASKFFSDVFYTNSRYAKVGGLPVHELNQLELQFLLLNDFHLTIPLDEMQRYADQLLMYGSGRPDHATRIKEPASIADSKMTDASIVTPNKGNDDREQKQ